MFLELQLLLSVGFEMDSRFLIGFSLSCSTSPDSLTKVVVFTSQYTRNSKHSTLSRGKNSFRLVALSHLHKSNYHLLSHDFNVKFNVYVQWIVALHMVTIPYKHRKHAQF